MFAEVALYVGLPAILALITYTLLALKRSGYFDEVQITVLDSPLILSSDLTVFYKYCLVKSYSGLSSSINEVKDILPGESARLFGIHYDENTKGDYKQAAVGCIYEIDGQPLFETNFAMQLTRWGFERMRLPKVNRAVHSRQKFNGYFSVLHLLNHTRQRMVAYLRQNNLASTVSIEICGHPVRGSRYLDVFRPLDHLDEFLVPEYVTQEQMRANYGRENSSGKESETDATESISDENLEDESEADFVTRP